MTMTKATVAGVAAALVLGLCHAALADLICGAGSDGLAFVADDSATPQPMDDVLWTSPDVELTPVPEPGTWLLLGTGMLLIIGYIRRRRIKT